MKSSGLAYQDAWNATCHDHPELLEGAHRALVNRPVGAVETVMNNLFAEQQRSGKAPVKKPGQVYPAGFAAGPRVNALRAAGAKI